MVLKPFMLCAWGRIMKIKTQCTINAERIANWSMYILVVLICIPLAMMLPGIVRMTLQVLSILMFLVSLILLKKIWHVLSIMILFGCSLLYYLLSWNEMMSASTFLFNSLCCWIFVIYGHLCITGIIKRSKIFGLVLIITLITALTTIIGLKQFPLAVRELGRSTSYSGEEVRSIYRVRNIASWSQVYGMVFIIASFLFFYKETKKKGVLLCAIATEICIFLSQLTFGVLLSFVAFAMILTNAKSRSYYIWITVIAIAVFLIIINLEIVLSALMDLTDALKLNMLTPKLQDLYNLVVLKSSTGDATSRFDLYMKSFNSFLMYPFGLFFAQGTSAVDHIGYHSEFFDFIGTLGIGGVAAIIIWVSLWVINIRKISDPYKHRFLLFIFLSFIVMMIFNPVFYSPQIWLGSFALPAQLVSEKNPSFFKSYVYV